MSEQIGWRSIAKTLKKELPHMAKSLPEMPRLLHDFLRQKTHAEADSPIRDSIERLIKTQQQQAIWQKRLFFSIALLALLEMLMLFSAFWPVAN